MTPSDSMDGVMDAMTDQDKSAPKYESGTYLVLLFNKHGTQVASHKVLSLEGAHYLGKARIRMPPAASYVIMRTMYNSIDAYFPWQVPEDDIDGFDIAAVKGRD